MSSPLPSSLPVNCLAALVPHWILCNWSKSEAVKRLVRTNLRRNVREGKGNSASRRSLASFRVRNGLEPIATLAKRPGIPSYAPRVSVFAWRDDE
mgnify:CR=1 FL=1